MIAGPEGRTGAGLEQSGSDWAGIGLERTGATPTAPLSPYYSGRCERPRRAAPDQMDVKPSAVTT